MSFLQDPPIIELPTEQYWYRIQLNRALKQSVRSNGFILRPPIGAAARFDLNDEPTAYLADSPETSMYESVFRREARNCSMQRLRARGLATFLTKKRLRLMDLRGMDEQFPVLVSQRYESTQKFAEACYCAELDGVIYSSAQHPSHSCLALFPTGISKMRRLSAIPLVKRDTIQLLPSVLAAIRGSQVPLVDD